MRSIKFIFIYILIVAVTITACTIGSVAISQNLAYLTFQIIMIETFILMVVICINEILSSNEN